MTKDQCKELIGVLANLMTDGGMFHDGVAPFTVQFGYVSKPAGICKNDGIVIRNGAAPVVVKTIMGWAEEQSPHVMVFIEYDGLFVH